MQFNLGFHMQGFSTGEPPTFWPVSALFSSISSPYTSGALGAGLAVFSRFPFIETSVHPYSLNGEPIDVGGGDWFVGKAAASVVILHPVIGRVQIFNTHVCLYSTQLQENVHQESSSMPREAKMDRTTEGRIDLSVLGNMLNSLGRQPNWDAMSSA